MSSKIVAALLVSLLTTTAQAALEPVPENRQEDFKTAVLQAIRSSALRCDATANTAYAKLSTNTGISKIVERATSILLDSSGAQPLLVVISDTTYDGSRAQVSISTSADFVTITKAVAQRLVREKQNHGTLLNPDIRDGFRSSSSVTCGN